MAKTYKELKEDFFDEVGKIDLSKLSIGFGGLKDYAELLKIMAELPSESRDDYYNLASANCALGFSGLSAPRKTEQEVK